MVCNYPGHSVWTNLAASNFCRTPVANASEGGIQKAGKTGSSVLSRYIRYRCNRSLFRSHFVSTQDLAHYDAQRLEILSGGEHRYASSWH
jgi:hypothetical protein